MKKLSMYLTIVRLGLKSRLTYRVSSFLEMVGRLIEFLVQILIWVALLGDGVRFDTSLEQMVTYLVITRFVGMLVATNAGGAIRNRIRDGSISNDFLRPVQLKGYLFFSDIGNNLFKAFAVFLPVCVIVALGYGFVLPESAAQVGFFVLTLAFGTFIMFYYNYILGLISFWLISNPFLRWHFRNVEQLFAGQFLPIWLYPAWLASVTTFMPFRYFTYEPIAIYLGKTPLENIPQVLCIQLFWMLALYIIERVMWRMACKKVIVQGG